MNPVRSSTAAWRSSPYPWMCCPVATTAASHAIAAPLLKAILANLRHAISVATATAHNQCSDACCSKPPRDKADTDATGKIHLYGCTRKAIQTCNRIHETNSTGGCQKDTTSGVNAHTYSSSVFASGVQPIPQMIQARLPDSRPSQTTSSDNMSVFICTIVRSNSQFDCL